MSFTRDFASTLPVNVLDLTTFDASCNGTALSVNGKIVDRLATGYYRYNAAQPLVLANYDMGTSTANSRFAAVSVKVQHSNTTSTSASGATGWADLSTGYQSCQQALFIVTNATGTSTSGNTSGYLSTSGGTATTSTGQATGQSAPSWYPLDQANQYLRIVVTPAIDGSSSGCGVMTLTGALIFGEPQYAGVGSPIQANNLGGGTPATTSTGQLIKSTS